MKWKFSRHARVSCSLIEVALTPSSETILCTSRYAYVVHVSHPTGVRGLK